MVGADLAYRDNQTQFGVIKETTKGTDPGGSVIYSPGGLADEADMPDPNFDLGEYRAAGVGRDAALITIRKASMVGRIPVILQDPRMIAWAFGLDTVTGASNPYTHTITKATDETLPTFTLESTYKAITGGSSNMTRVFAGCKVDETSISLTKEGELRADFGIQGRVAPTNIATNRTLTVDQSTLPFKYLNGVFTFFESAFARILDFNYRMVNSLSPQWYATSTITGYPYEIFEGPRGHVVEATVVIDDASVYTQLLAKNSFSANAKFTRAASPEDSIDFQWSNCYLIGASHPIGGAGGPIAVKMRIKPTTAQVVVKSSVSIAY